MPTHAYTEDQLVEQPSIGLFAALGWQTVSALDETFGASGTLGRETKGEVVLTPCLHAALTRLNPALPTEAITAAVDELTRDHSAMNLEAANREIYGLLKEGIKVSVHDRDHGGQKKRRLHTLNWEEPRRYGNNGLGTKTSLMAEYFCQEALRMEDTSAKNGAR